ncbi:MAG TPA: sugar transferase [Anaeromyxobacteraceae bacterium]|jgi:lipopolysaccharide/colanic/teichoic acid biosynthesis glycosyltransferase|nr:sugar transferase [Anaeromyxobacteraceae bacterium]
MTSAARLIKRSIDVAGASTGLVLLAPVMAAIALLVRRAMGSPVIFRQTRPGLGGRPFDIYKFRSMRPLRDGEVPYRTDDQRLTALGRFLRTSSLDELPELWNVLRGDMSLVGPRPLLLEYLDKYTPDEQRRHDVPPGLTGWAAVNGRNTIPFRERLALDLWYVDHWSLWLDLKILALTAVKVLRRSGVVATESDPALGFPLPPAPGREAPPLAEVQSGPTTLSGPATAPGSARGAIRPAR